MRHSQHKIPRRFREPRYCSVWLAMLALFVQLFTPYLHHPQTAHAADYPWLMGDLCITGSGVDIASSTALKGVGDPENEDDTSGKRHCPICLSIQKASLAPSAHFADFTPFFGLEKSASPRTFLLRADNWILEGTPPRAPPV